MSQPQTPQARSNVPAGLATRVEPSPRWIRVKFGGEYVANSRRALLLIQYPPAGLPTYYVPQADVRMDLLEPTSREGQPGDIAYWTVKAGGRAAERAASAYLDPPSDLADLQGHITFEWGKMDAWYEEDEEVFVHARDPHRRVDVIASSRHVRIVIAGETIAETKRPCLLFETDLPTRYYIPREDVRMDLLEPAGLKTRCPYKGVASYWSVRVGDQIARHGVWSYLDPIAEVAKIKDRLCFYNERVDLYVDGELQPRPQTMWSQ
jgi:uncharacterized protein (DUF427 family)